MSNTVDWLALLDQAKDSGVTLDRSPIPPARYAFKVVKAEATVSSNGNTMYKLTNEVQNGPHAGRYVFDNITLTENTVSWFFRKMNALGADEAFFKTNPTPQGVADRILNAFFEGEVEIEPARGNYEPRNRIAKWFRPSGGAPSVGGPAPQAYSTPAPAAAPQAAPAAPAPQAAPPAPAPQQGGAPAPAVDPWSTPAPAPFQGGAPAPAPAPWEAQAAPQAPWQGGAPAPAPAAPYTDDTPF